LATLLGNVIVFVMRSSPTMERSDHSASAADARW